MTKLHMYSVYYMSKLFVHVELHVHMYNILTTKFFILMEKIFHVQLIILYFSNWMTKIKKL